MKLIKYLNYIEQEIFKVQNDSKKELASNEISLYKEYWQLYKDDLTFNPLNPYPLALSDRHYFNFHTKEQIEIRWNIESIYLHAKNNLNVKYLHLEQFEKLVYENLLSSIEELQLINRKVQTLYKHEYQPILIMNFSPMNQYILLDGRHRYIEYKKFKKNELIPIYLVDDISCINFILHKNELVAYIITHNIKILNDFLFCGGNLEKLINIADYLKI